MLKNGKTNNTGHTQTIENTHTHSPHNREIIYTIERENYTHPPTEDAHVPEINKTKKSIQKKKLLCNTKKQHRSHSITKKMAKKATTKKKTKSHCKDEHNYVPGIKVPDLNWSKYLYTRKNVNKTGTSARVFRYKNLRTKGTSKSSKSKAKPKTKQKGKAVTTAFAVDSKHLYYVCQDGRVRVKQRRNEKPATIQKRKEKKVAVASAKKKSKKAATAKKKKAATSKKKKKATTKKKKKATTKKKKKTTTKKKKKTTTKKKKKATTKKKKKTTTKKKKKATAKKKKAATAKKKKSASAKKKKAASAKKKKAAAKKKKTTTKGGKKKKPIKWNAAGMTFHS
jgi:hypothetical protein